MFQVLVDARRTLWLAGWQHFTFDCWVDGARASSHLASLASLHLRYTPQCMVTEEHSVRHRLPQHPHHPSTGVRRSEVSLTYWPATRYTSQSVAAHTYISETLLISTPGVSRASGFVDSPVDRVVQQHVSGAI